MKTENKIISFILIWSIFTATASGYTLSGQITNNSIGINGTEISYGLNVTYSNISGYYSLSNLSGSISINFSKQPQYYLNSSSINMDSNQTRNVNLELKPTGTITGRVCVFPGCIDQTVRVAVSSGHWWF